MLRRQRSFSSDILHVAGLHWTDPGERVSDIQLDFSVGYSIFSEFHGACGALRTFDLLGDVLDGFT